MHRSAYAIVACLALVAACDSQPLAPALDLPALAAKEKDERPTNETTRTPFSRTVANPCGPTPELVAVEGYAHHNAHFKFFDGGNQSRLMTNSHASGIGLVSGLKYQFHELHTLRGRYTYANQRWETEQTTRFHVISQTGVDNFFSTLKLRIVYSPTGVDVQFVSLETDCRG